jgi:hypothetical protein
MKKPDCYYYGGGYCDKAVPFTPCEFKGCVAYTDHKPMTLAERKEEWLGKVEEHRKDLLKLALTADDIRQIIKINYEIIFKDTSGIKCKDVAEETLRRFNQWKEGQK